MSLILHDSENDIKPPLASQLPQPPSFNVYSCLIAATFTNELVFYPLGIEDACNQPSIDIADFKRPTAPFPRSLDLNSKSDALGIRPVYSAYLTANFITYLDSRITPSCFTNPTKPGTINIVSSSMLEEMKHAMTTSMDAHLGSGRSNTPATGPHRSQRSRRIAVTLLLPRVVSGRSASNRSDIMFLDALALISSATDTPLCSVDKHGLPGTFRKLSSAPRSLTDQVRLSVVAGGAAVASFANGIGLSGNKLFVGDEWKNNTILCFSYISGSEIVHIPTVLEHIVTANATPAKSVRIIQSAALKAQVLSKGGLLLPHGLISSDYVNLDDEALEAPFLQIQAEHQVRFKRMHLKETSIEVSQDTAHKINVCAENSKARFVRICSKNATMNCLCDESHCPGILFASNERLMDQYLHRNRLASPQDQWTRQWPPYGIGPPIDEERSASVSVLWFRVETPCVGASLNLFFPRSIMGGKVTDVDGCRIFSVVPTLCTVDSVCCAQNFILPCTPQSMIPIGPLSSRLYKSFASALDESCEFIFRMKQCPMTAMGLSSKFLTVAHAHEISDDNGEENAENYRICSLSIDSNTNESDFIAAIIGLRIGQPTSTCGQIYNALNHRSTSDLVASRSFSNLIAVGIAKLGPDVQFHQLMDDAANALAEKLCISDESFSTIIDGGDVDSPRSKRCRTPNGISISPATTATTANMNIPLLPQKITSSLRQDSHASGLSDVTIVPNSIGDKEDDVLKHHWSNPANAVRILSLASLTRFELNGFEGGSIVEFPMKSENLEDLLETIWLANSVGYNIYEQKSSSSKDGRLLSDRLGLPNISQHTQIEVFKVSFVFAYDAYNSIMAENGHNIIEDVNTFVLFLPLEKDAIATIYNVKRCSNGELCLDESTSYELLRPTTAMNKILFFVSSTTTQKQLPTKVQITVWRRVPRAVA